METAMIKPTNISQKSEERTAGSKDIKEKLIPHKSSGEQKSSLSGKSDIDKDKINKKLEVSNKEETETHKAKAETVKKLAEKIKNSKTLMIVSIKNLPSKQFQDIKKSLRGKAVVRVAKKNIMLRAIKKFGKESLLPLEKQIQENSAFVISDIEGFELAGILSKEKTPSSAKAGQIAPEDIEVKAGPTSLVPGPAISELGALGIQISIEEGKISIKAPKVIIKKGAEINESAASILQKLDIHPFNVGLEPIAIYDVQTEKIYSNIKIDSEETIEELKTAAGKALGFAQKIIYYCKDTIGYFLGKANSEEQALAKLKPKEEKVKEKEEPTTDISSEKSITDIEEEKNNKPISNKNLSDEKNSLGDESQDTKEEKEETDTNKLNPMEEK